MPGKQRTLIQLKNVKKHYFMGDNMVKAVDGITLEIKEKEFVSIMGPSGSGNGTALNLVGSRVIPTSGKIFLDGQDIALFTESELAQLRGRKIGFIFQSFNLIPNLTAKENVMIPMTFQDQSREFSEAKAEELLELVELGDRMEHFTNQLSGGQQQRVAIARALANDPDVILADEPTGNLDTKTGELVMDFLQKLNNEGKTIIMVTHDPELAKEHSDKIYWLKDGKIEKITKGK